MGPMGPHKGKEEATTGAEDRTTGPPEAAKGKEERLPRASGKYSVLGFRLMRSISGFGCPELQDNDCVLFQDTRFAVICHRSNRKLIWR